VLLVNQKHPLVEGLLKLKAGGVIVGDSNQSPSELLARDLALHLYETAKLSVGGLDPRELANYQTKNLKLMSQLMERGL
jgi:molecular chaperone HtpG